MAVSDWTMQRLADILDAPVDRPVVTETTALGAAYLAGLSADLCPQPAEAMTRWKLAQRFVPGLEGSTRQRLIAGWHDAVHRTLSTSVSAELPRV